MKDTRLYNPVATVDRDTDKSELVHLPDMPEVLSIKRIKAIALWFGALLVIVFGVTIVYQIGRQYAVPVLGVTVVLSTLLALWGSFLWIYTSRTVSRVLPPSQRMERQRARPATRPLIINTRKGKVETWLPNPERDIVTLDPWGLTAGDLMAFLLEVKNKRGLSEDKWVGPKAIKFSIPSTGEAVQFTRWRQLKQCVIDAGLAEKRGNAWVFTGDLEALKRQFDQESAW